MKRDCHVAKESVCSQLFILHFSFYINGLVGQPLVAILQVDDAAVSESVLQEYVLHDAVVPVRVRPQVGHLPPAPLQAGSRHPVDIRPACQSVDGGIGACVVQPCPFINPCIRRVRSPDKGESPHRLPRGIEAHIAVAPLNIPLDNLLRRVSTRPLPQVPTGAHDAPATIVQLHQRQQVIQCRKSDFQHIVFFCRKGRNFP